MTRVLLFVQTGDGRPKCVRRGAEAERVAALYARDEARNAKHPEHADHVPPYWLVECENAEAGRATIAFNGYCGDACADVRCEHGGCRMRGGRILASGGKP